MTTFYDVTGSSPSSGGGQLPRSESQCRIVYIGLTTLDLYASGFQPLPCWNLPGDLHTSADIAAAQHEVVAAATAAPADMIRFIREVSGLSATQLADIFHVSRRTIQAWMKGENVANKNLETMSRLHATMTRLDRGNARELRTALLLMQPDGVVCLDLLIDGRLDEVLDRLERRSGLRQFNLPPLSASARDVFKPPVHPLELLQPDLAPIRVESGKRRVVKPKRRK